MKKLFITVFLCVFMVIICNFSSFAALIISKPESVPTSANISKAQAIKDALFEWKSLSRKERNLRLKEAKAALKLYKATKKTTNSTDADTKNILLIVLAIILPPLAVYLKENAADSKFMLDLLLSLVGIIGLLIMPFLGVILWLAAIVYALIVTVGK